MTELERIDRLLFAALKKLRCAAAESALSQDGRDALGACRFLEARRYEIVRRQASANAKKTRRKKS